MKIISRIIETILAFIVLFTGFAVFSKDDCSCGQSMMMLMSKLK